MIGVFDSGLGGLTALLPLRRLLPNADIVYFGDTARVPYGSRSAETITRYGAQILSFLTARGAQSVLAACGTVSTVALPRLSEISTVPLYGVLLPACAAAARATKNGRIGVIATTASVASGAYERELARLLPGVRVTSVPCPLFVPLVEGGFIGADCEITHLAVRHYLSAIREAGADTLLLGCTHYPAIADIISAELPGVRLIDASAEAAAAIAASGSFAGSGKTEIYVSDMTQDFSKVASILGGGADLSVTGVVDMENS